jgi:uncharacterized protein YycO
MNRSNIPQRPKGRSLEYSENRQEIRTGDVLLFQGTSAVSRFIRWGSKSPYSHAGLALWWNERLLVVQSASRGVEILPASTAVERYDGQVDWWQPKIATRARLDFKALINAAFDELGKPFAVLPLVALVARMFKGEEWGNPDAGPNDHSYFCSQLVSRCYRKAGMDLVPNKADQDTSPGDLARCGHLDFLGVLRQHPLGVSPALMPLPDERPRSEIRAA